MKWKRSRKSQQEASKQRQLHNSTNGSQSTSNNSNSSGQSLNNSSSELVVNSNSNFSTNCTSASSSPSSSPVSFSSVPSPKQQNNSTAAQQLVAKSASLNSNSTNQHQLLSNVHLAQQALQHQANVSSLITNHSAQNYSTNHSHQLTTNNPNNQTVQAQSAALANMVNNPVDLATVRLNTAAQFNQFLPSLHHQFWQNLGDPFYRPFVS